MAESCLPPILSLPSPILGPLAQHRLPACCGAAVLYSHRAAGEHLLGLGWDTRVLPKCPLWLAGRCWCAPPPPMSLVRYGKQHFSDPAAPSHKLFLGTVGRERRAGKTPAPAPPGWEMLQGLQAVRLRGGGGAGVSCTCMHLYLHASMHISLCLYFHRRLCMSPQAYFCASSHACRHVCASMHTPCVWPPCMPCRIMCRSTFSFWRQGPTREWAQQGEPWLCPLWRPLAPAVSRRWCCLAWG